MKWLLGCVNSLRDLALMLGDDRLRKIVEQGHLGVTPLCQAWKDAPSPVVPTGKLL